MRITLHRIYPASAWPTHVGEKRLGLDGNIFDRRDRRAIGCWYGTLRLWWFKVDLIGGGR